MLSIGHFSKICMVSVKTLHHYDKIGLIHPYEVDPFTGYRYYDESQISVMLLICCLKRYGLALTDIRELISGEDKRVLFSKLKTQRSILQERISETAMILGDLERHLQDFERTGDIMSYQSKYAIGLEETTDRAILSSRQNMSVDEFGTYYGRLFEKVEREKLASDGTTMAIYHDEEFNHDCNDTELAIGLRDASQATRTLQGGLCAVTTHRGAYSTLSDAYGALTKWIGEKGYEINGSPYEIYLKTQFDHLPAEQWETKIYFPVKKK